MTTEWGALGGLPVWETARSSQTPCDGCDECGTRCVDGWECTCEEFRTLLEWLEAAPEVADVCRQPRELGWGDGTVRLCWFRDQQIGRCAVYPVRPLICRLFGHVEWLPCPAQRLTPAPGAGIAAIRWYAELPRATFAHWAGQPAFASRVGEALGAEVLAEVLRRAD